MPSEQTPSSLPQHTSSPNKKTNILKRKIRQVKLQLKQIDANRSHVNDKLHEFKQCSYYRQSMNKQESIHILIAPIFV